MRTALREAASETDAAFLQRYFRTGPGEYGAGDRFLGVRVPATRRVARQFAHATGADLVPLLQSRWHEERLLALLVMVHQHARADAATRDRIFAMYRNHIDRVNNWDLVDSSAPTIVGSWVERTGDRALLDALAESPNLWHRRIAMLATAHFIRRGRYDLTMRLARQLVHDPEDLIHKAVGWMLREVGARDRDVEDAFLKRHAATMPRTMLRYAIEKFPEALRREYLHTRRASPA